MAGPPFDAVRRGINNLINQLHGDPMAIEAVWISVITFGRQARVATPLTDITQFTTPHLVLGSGTALGAGLELLGKQIKSEIRATTPERKGDWKPIVFLLTDGDPTDRWEKAADLFHTEISGKKANIIAVACGEDVNVGNLRRITHSVLNLRDGSEASFRESVKITASVKTTSVKFSSGRAEGVELPSLPAEVTAAAGGGETVADRWVFLLVKCGRTKGLYLVRYRKEGEKHGWFGSGQSIYNVVAAQPLDDFEADGEGMGITVSTQQLHGILPCPYCENARWAMCSGCSRLMCFPLEDGKATCPWCSKAADYSTGNFDVSGREGGIEQMLMGRSPFTSSRFFAARREPNACKRSSVSIRSEG